MNYLTQYHPKFDEYWPEVERFFGDLSPHLYRQGMLLKNNLATFFSDTGQFKDILRRDHDHPLLHLPFWLFDDLNFPPGAERGGLEKHLLLASVFSFAAGYTQISILDEDSFFDRRHIFLQQALSQAAGLHLAQLFPDDAPFWHFYRSSWSDFAEAILWDLRDHAGQVTSFDETELRLLSDKFAPAKIPVAAVILKAGRDSGLAECLSMIDQLNIIFQVRQDIFAIRRDLKRGSYTYPIVRAMQAAGMDLRQPVNAERVLGALVLTDVIEEIYHESLGRLKSCRTMAHSLQLPTFLAYFSRVEDLLNEVRALFSIKKSKQSARSLNKEPRAFFLPAVDTLAKVMEMAEGYLLADLTFRESWEIQRRGVFNEPELVGKAFPSGLIIEALCRLGFDMSPQVDEVFKTLHNSGFRYYDHPHIPPDTDDLGLLLRLHPYASQPETLRPVLRTPLDWLAQNVGPAGDIPVWLIHSDYDFDGAVVSLWGHRCATVEANLLLGLIDYDLPAYQGLITKSAASWLDRFITAGLTATQHYVPLYGIWRAGALLTKLSIHLSQRLSPDKLEIAATTWLNLLERQANRRKVTSQDAAFLILACLGPTTPDSGEGLFQPAWLTTLFKHQRYDGSWPAEPLFGTPTRGEVAAWYASRSVTTAFCYQALKICRERRTNT